MATTTTWTATDASSNRQLIDELYERLDQDQDPNNTVILEVILDLCEQIGNIELALDVAHRILDIDPQHPAVNAFFSRQCRDAVSPAATASSSPGSSMDSTSASRTMSASSASSTTSPGIGNSIIFKFPISSPIRSRGAGGSTPGPSTASDSGSTSISPKSHRLNPIAALADGAPKAERKRDTERPLVFPAEPLTDNEYHALRTDLIDLTGDLQARATELEREIVIFENLGIFDDASIYQDTLRIKEGRLSKVVMSALPRPVRQLVRELHGDRQECLDLVVQDFAEVAQWTLGQEAAQASAAPVSCHGSDSGTSATGSNGRNNTNSAARAEAAPSFSIKRPPIDAVHERLRRRQELLDAMLPPGCGLEDLGRTAMMRVEHQLLDIGKTYANDKTMLLDDVAAIPPENLLVTSDNYAWDMSELADELAANSAVMRNPLTKDMFSGDDVRQILNHPLGQRLRPMAVEQSQLKHGVRADTIEQMETLGRVMLEDQSVHAAPTIKAIDVFLAYHHTLPEDEKRTLVSLKVPATYSHTGLAYHSAILEAVQYAKANRVCYHKVGDFLQQAAKSLKEDR